MKKEYLMIVFLVAFSLILQKSYAQDDAQEIKGQISGVYWSIKSSNPISIINPVQQKDFNMWDFPDEPVGIIHSSNAYYFFGSGSNQENGVIGQQGTYEFTGSLASITPAQIGPDQLPIPSLLPGLQEPSPDGSAFDRDYAGASFAYIANVTGYNPLWVLLYHGEFHQPYTDGNIHQGKFFSYAGGGIAVSYDQGKSFQKLGQLFSPHITLQDCINKNPQINGVLDGGTASWVEADKNGQPIETGRFYAPNELYYYVIVGDRNSWNTQDYGFAIARALKSDVLLAIAQKKTPVFMKYYVPSGNPQNGVNYFTQPAIGGLSTLLLNSASENEYIAHPQLVYDNFIGKFILSYNFNQRIVYIRFSSDLIHWSNRVLIAQAPAGYKLFYPTLAGDGPDPKVVGQHFYLYFTTLPFNGITSSYAQKHFMRRDIDIGQGQQRVLSPWSKE